MTTRRRLLRNIIAAGAGSAALGLSAASGAKENAQAAPCSVPHWDETFDVIVVGSGAAGMTAAVRCRSLARRARLRRHRRHDEGVDHSHRRLQACSRPRPVHDVLLQPLPPAHAP